MKYTIKKTVESPFIIATDGIITEVNKELANLTGYMENDILGKSLLEVSSMLKINSQISFHQIKNQSMLYLFNKDLQATEVEISYKEISDDNKIKYFIKEKQNSKIEDKLPYVARLLYDNEVGIAVYSIDHGVLLDINKRFLDFWDRPSREKILGKTVPELINGYKGSDMEKVILNIEKTWMPYHLKEVKHESWNNEITYWNISLVPIKAAKSKYIIIKASDISEQVINRKLVEEQNNELNAIIQNMSDGLHLVHKDYSCSLLNDAAKDFVYNTDSYRNAGDSISYTNYYDSDGKMLTMENFFSIRVLNGESLRQYRVSAHRPDGIRHFSISGSPIYDKNNKIIKAIICSSDITEQVVKSDLIKTQKDEFEAIIENMSDALVIFDKEGTYKKFNRACRDIFSFNIEKTNTIEELYKHYIFQYPDGTSIPLERSPVKKILSGKKVSNFKEIIIVDNKTFHAELNGTPIYDEHGNFIAGIMLIHDLTDKVKAEETLLIKTQLNLLNGIIENLQIGFVRCSYPEAKIIDINSKAYEYLNGMNPKIYSLQHMKGKNLLHVLNHDIRSEVISNLQEMTGKKIVNQFNYIKYTKAGEEKILKIIYHPLIGLNHQIIELVIIGIDISEEVTAKNEMEKVLKLQEELFTNIAHELKTPLNMICSTDQLIEFYLKNNMMESNMLKVSKGIDIIKQNCYRLTKLINNIIDLSKIESGYFRLNLSNENIVQIIEDIVQSVSDYIKNSHLNIIFDTNTEEKIIACDVDVIERIILNLISNAIKFTNNQGTIYVKILDKGSTIEISVRDTGIGIEKMHLENIFERFQQVNKSFTRDTEGSGIGLSLVKSSVELHNGRIWVESTPGKGSTFKVELPAVTIEDSSMVKKSNIMKDKVELVNIEFSDIYSL
ncbi:MAG: ATP-binding protein [Solirubrobacterales bacterium]